MLLEKQIARGFKLFYGKIRNKTWNHIWVMAFPTLSFTLQP